MHIQLVIFPLPYYVGSKICGGHGPTQIFTKEIKTRDFISMRALKLESSEILDKPKSIINTDFKLKCVAIFTQIRTLA